MPASNPPESTAKDTWSDAMRDARRERIIDAAARVFAEAGLDGASVRKIAAAAGCTTGAIYPLFKNKEEIYAELLMRSLSELRDQLVAAGENAETPAARVRAGASCILEYYLERPAEFAMSFYLSAGLKRKGVGEELNAALNERLADLNKLREHDMARCVGPENAAVESANLFSHITGLLVMELRGRFNVFAGDPRTLLARYLDSLLGEET